MSSFENPARRISSDTQSGISPDQVCQLYGPNAQIPESQNPVMTNIPVLYPCTAASQYDVSSAEPLRVAQLFQNSAPSIVQIDTRMFTGTGFIVSNGGAVVTDNHVIEKSGGSIDVTTADGRQYSATVVKQDPGSDLALLQIESNGQQFQPLPIAADNTLPKTGSEVLAIGHPKGWPDLYLSAGTYNGETTDPTNTQAYKMDPSKVFVDSNVHTEPGNSGSPLLNMQGQVIGVIDLGGPNKNTSTPSWDTESTSARDLRNFLNLPVSAAPPIIEPYSPKESWLGTANLPLVLGKTAFVQGRAASIFPALSAIGAGSTLKSDWTYASRSWSEANTSGKLKLAGHLAEDTVWLGASLAALIPAYRRAGALVSLGSSLLRAIT